MGHALNMREIKRQVLHVAIGTITLFLIIIGVLTPLYIFFILVGSVALSILSKDYRVPVVCWFLDQCERPKDREKFPGRGFVAFFAGVLLSVKLFPAPIAYASIMVLTLGDTVSHLIGAHIGTMRHPLNGNKSLLGNLAGSVAGWLGASFFVSPALAFFGAFGAMLIEAVQIRMNDSIVDDNIIVPLACGVIIMLIEARFWVF